MNDPAAPGIEVVEVANCGVIRRFREGWTWVDFNRTVDQMFSILRANSAPLVIIENMNGTNVPDLHAHPHMRRASILLPTNVRALLIVGAPTFVSSLLPIVKVVRPRLVVELVDSEGEAMRRAEALL